MNKRIIKTDQAPAAIGPYSQAVRIGNMFYTSGQIALDPRSGEFISGEIEQETERTLENISAILKADGLSLDNIVKTTVYLTDLRYFTRMNQILFRKQTRTSLRPGSRPAQRSQGGNRSDSFRHRLK